MTKAEATGLGVSLGGHLVLAAVLALGFVATRPDVPKEETVDVSFLEETGPVTSAPEEAAPPAAAEGEEQAPAGTPSGADASTPDEAPPVAEPAPEPEPEPVRTPVETADRRRPENNHAVPIQPRATPRPQPQPQPTPRPQLRPVIPRLADARPAQPQRRPPTPAPRQPIRPATPRSVFDANRLAGILGRGMPQPRGNAPRGTPGPSASASVGAPVSGARQAALARQIGGLIAPCATRAVPPNGFARSISVDLRVSVGQNGVPTGHQLVRSGGTNDDNQAYVPAVVDTAMRAVRQCAARIATLPAEEYAGWRTFTYRFHFP